jgi:uncharacterized protein
MTRAARIAGVVLALLAMQPAQAAPAPVPPPPDQPVIDCARPVYAIDTMICDDRDLGAANAEMDGLLAGLSFEGLDPGWIEPQVDWVRRRALCAFQPDGRACVADAFAERLAILRALRATGGANATKAQCRGANFPEDVVVERRPPAVLLRGAGGGVRVVAVAPGASSWRPFVAIGRDTGRQFVVKAKAARISCKIAPAAR